MKLWRPFHPLYYKIIQFTTMKAILYFEFLFLLLLFSCYKSPKDIVTKYYEKGAFNGSLLVMKNDHIIIDTALGFSNFQTQEKLTTNTSFYIASLSKPFTATAIILLQKKGLLSFDDKVSKYLSYLPDYAKDVTLRHLLTHTSGIRDYENILTEKKGLKNQDVIHWLQEQKTLQFPSGTQFEYSNSGYIILSLVIEKVSGQRYSQFLNENIFVPLKMNHTKVYDESRPIIEHKAIGYNKQKQLDDYSILTTGDGGIYSTAEDLYLFDRALRNFSLVSKRNTSLVYSPPRLANGEPSNYGFGWFIDDHGKTASHTGGLNGFRAVFWRDLQHNKTIIALTNQGDAFPLLQFINDLKKSL